MSQAASRPARPADEPEPTWEIAHLFPAQGQWSEREYLDLNTNRLIEFSNGRLEFPPMPTTTHQRIVFLLSRLLLAFVAARDLGEVLFAGVRVRLWPRKFREPDVVFMRKEHAERVGEKYWRGADLVMEVISGGAEDREGDLVKKRAEYARAKIPEYWIVDPHEERITVLRLDGTSYAVHGEFGKGTQATSHSLPGFAVDATAALSHRVPPASASQPRRKPKRRQ